MKRFDCLKLLASMIDAKTIVVANVGPISREWNALRPSDANLLQVNLGLCAAVGQDLRLFATRKNSPGAAGQGVEAVEEARRRVALNLQ